ncbi:MAG: EFR1 family ferrodoxin [Candidatus Bathyarchaeota archaeon]|jgi:ferredoxin/flavodoxin|nr:EFR1 family ferrodoxin [Candidatus Bathyarchaeota archaeon]
MVEHNETQEHLKTAPNNTEIYYFSGTGNSLHIAKELQKRIPKTKLTPILSLVNKESIKTTTETVGLCFPQYASMAPKIVEKFIEKLNLESAEYIFAVATRGRTECWAFREIDKILEKQGRSLDSFFVITMPSSSAAILEDPEAQITGDKIASLEAKAQNRLDSIQRIVAGKERNRDEDLSAVMPPPSILVPFLPVINLLIPILLPIGKMVESRFDFYHDDRCNGCGLCETVCLAGKVRMVDGRPVWSKDVKCYGCLGCFNFCPVESIQIKSKWYLKSYTEKNGRYHHPSITAYDVAGQKLESRS